MKGRPVDQMVYEVMFPRPKSNDPSNFHALLQRSLIPEVRQETHAFYGHLDTQEAKYPGLDYTHKTHRIRLSRWPWHRRLFRAFDSLALTDAEIAGLTKWEGTRWAKEKYEREQGIKIKDTTDDGFPDAADLPDWRPQRAATRRAVNMPFKHPNDEEDEEFMDVESDDELESVGLVLNERLRAQAARREAGDTQAVLDEEWEQWLKNALESGELAFLSDFFRTSDQTSLSLLPAGIIDIARAGQWSEIPEFLHPLLRRTLEAEDAHRRVASRAGVRPSVPSRPTVTLPPGGVRDAYRRHYIDDRIRVPWPRRTYSDLRLPVGESGPSQRAAEASGA